MQIFLKWMQNSFTILLLFRQGGSTPHQTSCMMFSLTLRRTWLTVMFWNSVCSQLLYENYNQWDNKLIRDSNEESKQLSQERLESLLKETKLASEFWRTRHETLTEYYNKLPTTCKEHVHNGMYVEQFSFRSINI